jgi:ParB-like chromosome segregation protein Spo0J
MVMGEASRMKTSQVPIEKPIPDSRSARTHSDQQVAQVAASIQEFGWTNPILIRPNGTLIAGHARLLAARRLGLSEVPVIELRGLSEVQCRALAIADNQIALGAGWDEEMVPIEIAALQEESFDLDLRGFGDDELALLAADAPIAGRTDEDAVSDVTEVAGWRSGRPEWAMVRTRRRGDAGRGVDAARSDQARTQNAFHQIATPTHQLSLDNLGTAVAARAPWAPTLGRALLTTKVSSAMRSLSAGRGRIS